MPRGDGRGAGFCSGSSAPGFTNRAASFFGGRNAGGRGRGCERNGFFGRGNGFGRGYQAFNQQGFEELNDVKYLKSREEYLEKELSALKQKIKECGESEQ
ncbi:MAG TPA: DUF5320 domain-containing protein [Spirochaetota bacterium]|nr:DUF5320 domain-containing protein [Spirochaetota bacterium]HOR44570.1 DUF5320 domain-containing protein [Spirochaetota bacterium]HPK55985.1 DUF5320 domain-containing protein [Spirochaetota bacterium]